MKNFFPALLGVLLGTLSITSAHAQILLTINVTNPGAVTITATGSFPSASVDAGSYANGIDLLGFFTGDAGISNEYTDPTSTLTAGDASTGTTLTYAAVDNYSSGNVDLSIFTLNSTTDLTFTAGPTGSPAFSGTMTLNLSGEPLQLTTAPSSGTIIAGYSGGGPQLPIGQWEVEAAPEPSTWALILGGLGVLAFFQRKMRRA